MSNINDFDSSSKESFISQKMAKISISTQTPNPSVSARRDAYYRKNKINNCEEKISIPISDFKICIQYFNIQE